MTEPIEERQVSVDDLEGVLERITDLHSQLYRIEAHLRTLVAPPPNDRRLQDMIEFDHYYRKLGRNGILTIGQLKDHVSWEYVSRGRERTRKKYGSPGQYGLASLVKLKGVTKKVAIGILEVLDKLEKEDAEATE